jgi:hypothetical protein
MAIEEVLERHEERLMALSGVAGVGIAERAGRPVILVMLDRPAPELRGRLPAQLEGFAVETEVVGEITAY